MSDKILSSDSPIDRLAQARLSRRRLLGCMGWAGTGLLWTMVAGVPRASSIGGAWAANAASDGAFSFAQISDSHIGFSKAPNADPAATLQEAIDDIRQLPTTPSLLIHTGDVSQLSKPEQFDTAEQIIRGAHLDTFYVPGEHDTIGDNGAGFFQRFSRGNAKGYYSFEQRGVHFIALVNVIELRAGGLGYLGAEQLEWLRKDVEHLSSSTPIIVFAHMPLWAAFTEWGWGTDDAAQALSHLQRFGSVTVLNGHIHQVLQKVEGHVAFHTARSTAFPQAAPGSAQGPGPLAVPAGELKSALGITSVTFESLRAPALIADTTLASALHAHADPFAQSIFLGG